MSTRFAVNDIVRVRHPLSPAEGRLAVIAAIQARPGSSYADSYRLRFPNGDESNFYAREIRPHNPEADRRAILRALITATDHLRRACLIAHDYDDGALSAEILFAYSQIVGTARTHLDTDLHPPQPHEHSGADSDEASGGHQ